MSRPQTPVKPRPHKPSPKGCIVKALRIESDLWVHAKGRVKSEDLDFSKYVRRLIRADLQSAKGCSIAA
jgi:hypothetical protein